MKYDNVKELKEYLQTNWLEMVIRQPVSQSVPTDDNIEDLEDISDELYGKKGRDLRENWE